MYQACLPNANVGKSRGITAYDPRTPLDITDYIKDTSRLKDYCMHKFHQDPNTNIVIGISSQRQLVVWRYTPVAARRELKGQHDRVECKAVVRRPQHSGASVQAQMVAFFAGSLTVT